ncbi:uncharacterized protein MYCGRDRAFT_103909 [Zymoseptoria tritici IPO323]|uniref:Uncharacterized protein n=1 Tax=Zymoseptoria tritici (strain CBS 115943 / IPO323) TaxID=336722 RepID=F9X5X7_ZYMTI|nr:uncharacterized protein MYCGRDRAFT_103909 [Zymoseptoria tritici IPO323]EGP89211.1 hypothetical protein MYCGRDRAFT_103909 [Zymoseptoria tritici IPO323]
MCSRESHDHAYLLYISHEPRTFQRPKTRQTPRGDGQAQIQQGSRLVPCHCHLPNHPELALSCPETTIGRQVVQHPSLVRGISRLHLLPNIRHRRGKIVRLDVVCMNDRGIDRAGLRGVGYKCQLVPRSASAFFPPPQDFLNIFLDPRHSDSSGLAAPALSQPLFRLPPRQPSHHHYHSESNHHAFHHPRRHRHLDLSGRRRQLRIRSLRRPGRSLQVRLQRSRYPCCRVLLPSGYMSIRCEARLPLPGGLATQVVCTRTPQPVIR